MKAWKNLRKIKYTYSHKLLLFMVLSVCLMCSLVFGYFVVNMRNQMEDYVHNDLNHTLTQSATKIRSELNNLQRIMYNTLMDSHLWQRLVTDVKSPIETWELYNYVNGFYDTLLASDDRIVLATIYVDNNTIPEDKTYIRHFDDFTALKAYEKVCDASGAVIMLPMTEVFPEDYYTFNRYSSKSNYCLLRTSEYRGIRFGLVLEFSLGLFEEHLNSLHEHRAYLLDENNIIALCFDHTTNRTKEMYGEVFDDINHGKGIVQDIGQSWKVAVLDEGELLHSVDKTIVQMTFYAAIGILTLLLVMIQILWKMTGRLRNLTANIRTTMAQYGGISDEWSGDGDELDQALNSFKSLKDRVNYLMSQVMEKELARRDAELRLLYSQIKPHFLYNTLSCVMSLARKYHDERLENMISSLSDIYRISLNRGRDNITVRDEIRLTESYLYIIRNRFEDMIQVTMDIAQEIKDSVVPKVILQPFIENCVTHALDGDKVLHISIKGYQKADQVILSVEDDGAGISEDRINAIFNSGDAQIGFGVRNVHHRIQLLYGTTFGVHLCNKTQGGTVATLTLPYCPQWELTEKQGL